MGVNAEFSIEHVTQRNQVSTETYASSITSRRKNATLKRRLKKTHHKVKQINQVIQIQTKKNILTDR